MTDLSVLEVYEILAGLYFIAGTAWLLLMGKIKEDPKSLCLWILSLPFVPVFFLWMLILIIISTPYWWLYPEKHATRVDFEGTKDEKKTLQDYRLACGKRGFFRRLIENLRFTPSTKPPYPFKDG